MSPVRTIVWVIVTYLCFTVSLVHAQPETSSNPLLPFERLIGGQWHLDQTYQVFEWGVGKTSVKVQSFYQTEGGAQLMSEGFWFWHPGEKKIKGIFTAVGMAIVYFEYDSEFSENQLLNTISTFNASGELTEYQEIWQFKDPNTYDWTLLIKTPTGLEKNMTGTFKRQAFHQK